MKTSSIANAYLILSLLLGAMVPVMLKLASQNINIYEFLFFVYLLAFPISFIFVLSRKKAGRLVATAKNWKEFAFIALLGILFYGMLEFGLTYAERYISSALATVIYRSAPLLMLIFLPIMLRERISKYQVIALLLAFAGVYIALTAGSLSIFDNANIAMIGLVLAIALLNAFVTVAIKKYSFDMDIAIFIFSFAGFLFFTATFIAAGSPFQSINPNAYLAIIYIGIVYNVFVSLIYYNAFRMLKSTFVTNIYFLSPFITLIFSWLIFGEKIYLYYIAIAVLVSVGLIIQVFDKKGGTYIAINKTKHIMHDVTAAFVDTRVPAIYNAIRSGGRVLAIKLEVDIEEKKISDRIRNHSKKGDTIIYSSSNGKFVNKEQQNFINEILNAENNIIIMGAGEPAASEMALSEIAESIK